MGRLVPEDFDVAGLENEAERRVVSACASALSDGWFVLPNVVIKAATRDHELDVVLVHREFGVLDLEVKGHHSASSGDRRLLLRRQVLHRFADRHA